MEFSQQQLTFVCIFKYAKFPSVKLAKNQCLSNKVISRVLFSSLRRWMKQEQNYASQCELFFNLYEDHDSLQIIDKSIP